MKIGRHASGKLYTTLTVNGAKKYIYGDTEAEVEAKYLELKYMSGQGFNVTENPTMKEYAVKWYNLFKKPKKGKGGAVKTKEMYINAVEVHIIPALGHKKIKDITTSDIQALLNQASSSMSLQHKVRITLNQIFEKAIADRLIAYNPIIGTDPVETPDPIRQFYTPEQLRILISHFQGRKIFPLIFTILNTGMRATEALALMRNRDLDLDNNRIFIRESTEFVKARPQKKPTKTTRGVRTIPVPPAFSDWLREHLKTVKSLYVFPGHDGRQMGQTTLDNWRNKANRRIERWFAEAEAVQKKAADGGCLSREEEALLGRIQPFGDIREHRFRLHYKTLRHTYCTELFDLGVDELSAAKIMGHTVTIMREIYTHIQKNRQRKTIEKIEGLYADVEGLHGNVVDISTLKQPKKVNKGL